MRNRIYDEGNLAHKAGRLPRARTAWEIEGEKWEEMARDVEHFLGPDPHEGRIALAEEFQAKALRLSITFREYIHGHWPWYRFPDEP